MQKITFLILTFFVANSMYGQDITGQWNGALSVQGNQLRLVINILKTDSGYRSTMDSPDQGAKDIPVTSTMFKDSILSFEVADLRIEYKGILNNLVIAGTFKQGGLSFPLNFSREKIEKKSMIRPQEPAKPYPYISEEVKFENGTDKITLTGTLTLPKKEGRFPAVVLITGSGPQNRDEELMGHKPFLVLSDYLTRNGIAVLRYDDRGVGQSNGDFNTATSADFALDATSAIKYLQTRKEIDQKKIGLIGHSEGGMIAPMVASKSKDIAFIVLLAGPGVPGNQLLLLQQSLIAKASGTSNADIKKLNDMYKGVFDMIVRSTNPELLKAEMTDYLRNISKGDLDKPAGMNDDDYIKLQIVQVLNPWMIYFLKYNPAIALEKVKCPVLAINGEKDLQVPPKENLEAIRQALEKGGNKTITTKEFPNLNHLFQECKTGLLEEYATIEQTFSPTALKVILQWIILQAK